jgi:hypothetical protein
MAERIHSLHLPPKADPARTLLIADRWRWGAFLFPLLWALWNRHWLALAPILLAGAVTAGLAAARQPEAAAAFELAYRLALGFEGATLARLDRRLRGWRELAAISARNETEAEWIWFGAPEDVAALPAPRRWRLTA